MRLRFIIIVSLFVSISCNKTLIIQKRNESKSQDIIEAFRKVFLLESNSSVRIIASRENSNLLDLSSLKLPYELLSIKLFASNRTKIITSSSYVNAILYNHIDEIFSIFSKHNLQIFRLDGYFMLLSFDECSQNVDKIFDFLWKRQIFNINLICKFKAEILMKTFLPYKLDSCSNTSSTVINKYLNDSWSEEIKFPLKLKNLFNCHLKVASFVYPPITMRETLPDRTFRYYGSEMELLFGLADALKFDINHTYIETSGSSGILYDNGTATGILNDTIEGRIDMLMSFYYLTYQRTRFLSFSQSHYSVPLVIMIPQGMPFSPFEKLFNPLQLLVWVCLCTTILFGMIAIAIISCQNEKIKIFVFGRNIKSPYMNLINVLLNGIQNVLPKTTFARSLLMIFMIFCFILRTLYQGSLYQFLQADDRAPEVGTIDEMMTSKFDFYIRETLEHNIKNMSFYSRRKVVKFSDYPELRQKTLDPTFKGGIIMPLLEVIYLNQQTYKNFTFKVLKEYLFDVQIVYYFPKNFHLVKAIDEKMGILKAAGLVSMWMDKYIDKSYLKIKDKRIGPRKINLVQLLGGFEIWICGVLLSMVVFLIENLMRLKMCKRNHRVDTIHMNVIVKPWKQNSR